MSALKTLLSRQKTVAAGVAGAMLLLGAALYPSLPERMAIHWSAPGEPDGTTSKAVAVLLMPAVIVLMSALFELTGVDAEDRLVGSVAMLGLLVVQVMVFLTNLGVDVPIFPVAMALGLAIAALAIWFERR